MRLKLSLTRRVVEAGLLGCLLASFSSGCGAGGGSDSNDTGDASNGGEAAAGSSGTAGESGGDGGTGAGGSMSLDPATATAYQACVAYANAQCNRRFFECEGKDPVAQPCPTAVFGCPDIFFSEGSTRTIADTLACAEVWTTFPCEQIDQDIFPDCTTNGTQAVGAPCLHPSQCETGFCGLTGEDPAHPDCSQCLPIAEPGGQCDPYGAGPACPEGYDCSTDENICLVKMDPEPPPPPVGLGKSCADNPCEAPLLCDVDPEQPEEGPVCEARTALGQPCTNAFQCVLEGYCGVQMTCEPWPGEGEPCAMDFGGSLRCLAPLFCDMAPNGPTCRGLFAVGEPCTPDPLGRFRLQQGRCDSGLFCDCTDESCDAGRCVNIAFESEACGNDANTVCAPGTECVAGVCVGVESQGKFAALCGG